MKKGFTLAEILITLAVIGVVAAMAIPAVLQNSQNQETVARVKKVYYALSDSYKSLKAEGLEMTSIFAGDNNHSNISNVFATKLQVIKNCGTSAGCTPGTNYKHLNGNNLGSYVGTGDIILNDGTLIYFYDYIGDCGMNRGSGPLTNACGEIYVDVNGFKGPNVMGRDMFFFWPTVDGIYPDGTYGRYGGTFNDCNSTSEGFSCSGKILKEGALNY